MKLEISSYADGGDHAKERLIVKATADVDIGGYALLCSSVSANKTPTAGKKTAFWFPDVQVKSGDLVVLYTKNGSRSQKTLDTGGTAHFFYWGVDTALWGGGSNCAVLMEVATWKHKLADGAATPST